MSLEDFLPSEEARVLWSRFESLVGQQVFRLRVEGEAANIPTSLCSLLSCNLSSPDRISHLEPIQSGNLQRNTNALEIDKQPLYGLPYIAQSAFPLLHLVLLTMQELRCLDRNMNPSDALQRLKNIKRSLLDVHKKALLLESQLHQYVNPTLVTTLNRRSAKATFESELMCKLIDKLRKDSRQSATDAEKRKRSCELTMKLKSLLLRQKCEWQCVGRLKETIAMARDMKGVLKFICQLSCLLEHCSDASRRLTERPPPYEYCSSSLDNNSSDALYEDLKLKDNHSRPCHSPSSHSEVTISLSLDFMSDKDFGKSYESDSFTETRQQYSSSRDLKDSMSDSDARTICSKKGRKVKEECLRAMKKSSKVYNKQAKSSNSASSTKFDRHSRKSSDGQDKMFDPSSAYLNTEMSEQTQVQSKSNYSHGSRTPSPRRSPTLNKHSQQSAMLAEATINQLIGVLEEYVENVSESGRRISSSGHEQKYFTSPDFASKQNDNIYPKICMDSQGLSFTHNDGQSQPFFQGALKFPVISSVPSNLQNSESICKQIASTYKQSDNHGTKSYMISERHMKPCYSINSINEISRIKQICNESILIKQEHDEAALNKKSYPESGFRKESFNEAEMTRSNLERKRFGTIDDHNETIITEQDLDEFNKSRKGSNESKLRERYFSEMSSEQDAKESRVNLQHHEKIEKNQSELDQIKMSERDLDEIRMSKQDLNETRMSQKNQGDTTVSNQDLYKTRMSQRDLDYVRVNKSDLQDTRTSKRDLVDARLSQRDLDDSKISKKDLYDARTSQSDLVEARISRRDLDETRMSKTDLHEVRMSKKDLDDNRMSKRDHDDARLSQGDLEEARISRRDLDEAKMSKIDLDEARMSKIDLDEARMSKIDLDEARMIKNDLGDKSMSHIDLNETRPSSKDQDETRMGKRDPIEARISKQDLRGVRSSRNNLNESRLNCVRVNDHNSYEVRMIHEEFNSAKLSNRDHQEAKVDTITFNVAKDYCSSTRKSYNDSRITELCKQYLYDRRIGQRDYREKKCVEVTLNQAQNHEEESCNLTHKQGLDEIKMSIKNTKQTRKSAVDYDDNGSDNKNYIGRNKFSKNSTDMSKSDLKKQLAFECENVVQSQITNFSPYLDKKYMKVNKNTCKPVSPPRARRKESEQIFRSYEKNRNSTLKSESYKIDAGVANHLKERMQKIKRNVVQSKCYCLSSNTCSEDHEHETDYDNIDDVSANKNILNYKKSRHHSPKHVQTTNKPKKCSNKRASSLNARMSENSKYYMKPRHSSNDSSGSREPLLFSSQEADLSFDECTNFNYKMAKLHKSKESEKQRSKDPCFAETETDSDQLEDTTTTSDSCVFDKAITSSHKLSTRSNSKGQQTNVVTLNIDDTEGDIDQEIDLEDDIEPDQLLQSKSDSDLHSTESDIQPSGHSLKTESYPGVYHSSFRQSQLRHNKHSLSHHFTRALESRHSNRSTCLPSGRAFSISESLPKTDMRGRRQSKIHDKKCTSLLRSPFCNPDDDRADGHDNYRIQYRLHPNCCPCVRKFAACEELLSNMQFCMRQNRNFEYDSAINRPTSMKKDGSFEKDKSKLSCSDFQPQLRDKFSSTIHPIRSAQTDLSSASVHSKLLTQTATMFEQPPEHADSTLTRSSIIEQPIISSAPTISTHLSPSLYGDPILRKSHLSAQSPESFEKRSIKTTPSTFSYLHASVPEEPSLALRESHISGQSGILKKASTLTVTSTIPYSTTSVHEKPSALQQSRMSVQSAGTLKKASTLTVNSTIPYLTTPVHEEPSLALQQPYTPVQSLKTLDQASVHITPSTMPHPTTSVLDEPSLAVQQPYASVQSLGTIDHSSMHSAPPTTPFPPTPDHGAPFVEESLLAPTAISPAVPYSTTSGAPLVEESLLAPTAISPAVPYSTTSGAPLVEESLLAPTAISPAVPYSTTSGAPFVEESLLAPTAISPAVPYSTTSIHPSPSIQPSQKSVQSHEKLEQNAAQSSSLIPPVKEDPSTVLRQIPTQPSEVFKQESAYTTNRVATTDHSVTSRQSQFTHLSSELQEKRSHATQTSIKPSTVLNSEELFMDEDSHLKTWQPKTQDDASYTSRLSQSQPMSEMSQHSPLHSYAPGTSRHSEFQADGSFTSRHSKLPVDFRNASEQPFSLAATSKHSAVPSEYSLTSRHSPAKSRQSTLKSFTPEEFDMNSDIHSELSQSSNRLKPRVFSSPKLRVSLNPNDEVYDGYEDTEQAGETLNSVPSSTTSQSLGESHELFIKWKWIPVFVLALLLFLYYLICYIAGTDGCVGCRAPLPNLFFPIINSAVHSVRLIHSTPAPV